MARLFLVYSFFGSLLLTSHNLRLVENVLAEEAVQPQAKIPAPADPRTKNEGIIAPHLTKEPAPPPKVGVKLPVKVEAYTECVDQRGDIVRSDEDGFQECLRSSEGKTGTTEPRIGVGF